MRGHNVLVAIIISCLGASQAVATQSSDLFVLKVDKSKLSATLSTLPAEGQPAQPLREFRIAIGKKAGDKQVEGDNKTPEGIYFTQKHIPGSQLPKKYGAKAIPLDFPNLYDRRQSKTGHGIWLHGVDDAKRIEEANVTEGCVAFFNPDIDKLGAWLQPFQGIVVIADSLDELAPEIEDEVKRATQDWMDAWERRDLEEYVDFYDESFRYKGMNRAQYRAYKKRVFASYKKMVVSFEDLRIVTHPKYVFALFNQDFFGDNRFRSAGRKTLYWVKDSQGKWRISIENFEDRRFRLKTYSEAEVAILGEKGYSAPDTKVKEEQQKKVSL